jgi:hypothetical protein
VRERMRKDTITQLEIRDEEQLYRAMFRGELEAKEQHARRAYAAAPKDVSAELKTTAQAEADQRQAAVEAQAQGDRKSIALPRRPAGNAEDSPRSRPH